MPGVTKDQIKAAKRITAMEFLRRHRPDQLEKDAARGEFHLKEHDSFKINERTSLWHWKSRDIGGRSALDYLIKVEGMDFMEAVRQLCGDLPDRYIPLPPVPKKEFSLPLPAENNRRVFAYLLKRGIDQKVIKACVQAGILYESAQYHNAVFVGKDDQGVPRYAFLRGTYTRGKPFKAEVSGSDKSYCFCLPPCGTSRRVAVYEAAIETLAHLTLEKTADKYRLSLGGIYAPVEGVESRVFKPPTALESFLAHHPEITEIEICTNNDAPGRWAGEHMAKHYQGKYQVTVNLPPREGMDFADLAKQQAVHHRTGQNR